MLTKKFLKKLPINSRITFRYFHGSQPGKRRYITYRGLDSKGNILGQDNRIQLESGLKEYRRFNPKFIAETKVVYVPHINNGTIANLNNQLISMVYNKKDRFVFSV